MVAPVLESGEVDRASLLGAGTAVRMLGEIPYSCPGMFKGCSGLAPGKVRHDSPTNRVVVEKGLR